MVLFIKREIRSRQRGWVALFSLLLVALMAKIIFETVTGGNLFVSHSHTGMVSVPLAHLVGGLVGCGVAVADGSGKGDNARKLAGRQVQNARVCNDAVSSNSEPVVYG